ncbi:hypothetical protein A2U01_0111425, partial [Trifolium medium]|nr:hypothetical protein [Trifolium medium]
MALIEKEHAATKERLEKEIKTAQARFDEEVGNRVKAKENEWAAERKTHMGEIQILREKVKTLEDQLAST